MDSEKDCQQKKVGLYKVGILAELWESPSSVHYSQDKKSITINDVNVWSEVQDAIKAYDDKNFMEFGNQMGQASTKVLKGTEMKEKLGPGLNPQSVYFNTIGSDFANGFLFGAKVGHLKT